MSEPPGLHPHSSRRIRLSKSYYLPFKLVPKSRAIDPRRPSASWRAAEGLAPCILLWWDTERVDRRPQAGRTGDGRLRLWRARPDAGQRHRCNLMLGTTAAMIGWAQAGPAAGVQLGAVGDADPAGAGAPASAAEARSTIRIHSRRLAPAAAAAGHASGAAPPYRRQAWRSARGCVR